MLKFIIFGIGFVLLFEGLIYFIFSNKIKFFFKIVSSYNAEKIKSFSILLALLGFCIIYFTFRYYEFN